VAEAAPEPVELPPVEALTSLPEPPEPEPDTTWHAVKRTLKRGWFDPFQAFELEVDRERFWRAQGFLFLASLFGPLLMMLLLGLIPALIFQVAAAINGFTPPNPFYEVTVYPVVFILAKGYWVAYLVLPLAVLLGGWLWAAATAWSLARNSGTDDFGKMFCILALLGSMYAPFSMFPFIRLVALAGLIWFVARRMDEYFGVTFLSLAKRGGILLLIVAAGDTWFERKVESSYTSNSELSANLSAFYNTRRKLEWPAFRTPMKITPLQALLENLGSMNPEIREKATRSALAMLSGVLDPPEDRFKVALRMAEMGNQDGMLYLARAYQSGQGVPPDSGQSLTWVGKVMENESRSLECSMALAQLLIQNKRGLEGKRMFVQLAKVHMADLAKIAAFTSRAGFGTPEAQFTWEVQNLYSSDSSNANAYSKMNSARNGYSSNGQWYGDATTLRQNLLQRLRNLDAGGTQWLYRALITEYGIATKAEPEVYGEAAVDLSSDEALENVPKNDPAALTAIGNSFAEKGNDPKAREYWRKATMALNSDNRAPNARLYLRLAESLDPAGHPILAGDKDSPEAIRCYLGFLLLDGDATTERRRAVVALKRLGVPVEADPMFCSSNAFYALCARHELAEGLVLLGSELTGGGRNRTPVNLQKAKECFQKARELGYQGPIVHTL
jgi:tetratricopeptide (TPR) repeat protein